jgi:hypothetical protein
MKLIFHLCSSIEFLYDFPIGISVVPQDRIRIEAGVKRSIIEPLDNWKLNIR